MGSFFSLCDDLPSSLFARECPTDLPSLFRFLWDFYGCLFIGWFLNSFKLFFAVLNLFYFKSVLDVYEFDLQSTI